MFNASDLIYVVPAIFISLAFHEAMHAFAAHALGDDTAKIEGRLTLNPLKHVDLYTTIILPIITILIAHFPILIAKPVPFNPQRVKFGEFGAAIVGIAGPISNLLLSIIAAVFLHIFNLPSDVFKFLIVFTEINVWFFIFNMVPIPPLDGSRLLYSFAPEWLQEGMRRIESYGYYSFFLIFILVFYFPGPLDYCFNHLMNILLG
jgi:Zn-dependent protease